MLYPLFGEKMDVAVDLGAARINQVYNTTKVFSAEPKWSTVVYICLLKATGQHT